MTCSGEDTGLVLAGDHCWGATRGGFRRTLAATILSKMLGLLHKHLGSFHVESLASTDVLDTIAPVLLWAMVEETVATLSPMHLFSEFWFSNTNFRELAYNSSPWYSRLCLRNDNARHIQDDDEGKWRHGNGIFFKATR